MNIKKTIKQEVCSYRGWTIVLIKKYEGGEFYYSELIASPHRDGTILSIELEDDKLKEPLDFLKKEIDRSVYN